LNNRYVGRTGERFLPWINESALAYDNFAPRMHSDGTLKEARDLEQMRRSLEESYKVCWERETAGLTAELSMTQSQFELAKQELAAIHNSPESAAIRWVLRYDKQKYPSSP
jgi:hypothetical protein